MNKNYYDILGVDKNASESEIKAAFRALAHKHHPDKGGDEAKFKEINEAYQVLSDKQKRAQYDRFGSANSSFGGQGAHDGFAGYGNYNSGWQGGGFNVNYADFMRANASRHFTVHSLKKVPLLLWFLLLPFLIVIVIIVVIILIFLLFRSMRRVFSN